MNQILFYEMNNLNVCLQVYLMIHNLPLMKYKCILFEIEDDLHENHVLIMHNIKKNFIFYYLHPHRHISESRKQILTTISPPSS